MADRTIKRRRKHATRKKKIRSGRKPLKGRRDKRTHKRKRIGGALDDIQVDPEAEYNLIEEAVVEDKRSGDSLCTSLVRRLLERAQYCAVCMKDLVTIPILRATSSIDPQLKGSSPLDNEDEGSTGIRPSGNEVIEREKVEEKFRKGIPLSETHFVDMHCGESDIVYYIQPNEKERPLGTFRDESSAHVWIRDFKLEHEDKIMAVYDGSSSDPTAYETILQYAEIIGGFDKQEHDINFSNNYKVFKGEWGSRKQKNTPKFKQTRVRFKNALKVVIDCVGTYFTSLIKYEVMNSNTLVYIRLNEFLSVRDEDILNDLYEKSKVKYDVISKIMTSNNNHTDEYFHELANMSQTSLIAQVNAVRGAFPRAFIDQINSPEFSQDDLEYEPVCTTIPIPLDEEDVDDIRTVMNKTAFWERVRDYDIQASLVNMCQTHMSNSNQLSESLTETLGLENGNQQIRTFVGLLSRLRYARPRIVKDFMGELTAQGMMMDNTIFANWIKVTMRRQKWYWKTRANVFVILPYNQQTYYKKRDAQILESREREAQIESRERGAQIESREDDGPLPGPHVIIERLTGENAGDMKSYKFHTVENGKVLGDQVLDINGFTAAPLKESLGKELQWDGQKHKYQASRKWKIGVHMYGTGSQSPFYSCVMKGVQEMNVKHAKIVYAIRARAVIEQELIKQEQQEKIQEQQNAENQSKSTKSTKLTKSTESTESKESTESIEVRDPPEQVDKNSFRLVLLVETILQVGDITIKGSTVQAFLYTLRDKKEFPFNDIDVTFECSKQQMKVKLGTIKERLIRLQNSQLGDKLQIESISVPNDKLKMTVYFNDDFNDGSIEIEGVDKDRRTMILVPDKPMHDCMSDFKQSQLTLTYDSETHMKDHIGGGIVLKSPENEYTFQDFQEGIYPQEFLDIVAHKYTIDIPREVIIGKPMMYVDRGNEGFLVNMDDKGARKFITGKCYRIKKRLQKLCHDKDQRDLVQTARTLEPKPNFHFMNENENENILEDAPLMTHVMKLADAYEYYKGTLDRTKGDQEEAHQVLESNFGIAQKEYVKPQVQVQVQSVE